jgi:hypothetical protein
MSLLDVALAHAREVPRRPVMEGVRVSSEGGRKASPARARGQPFRPPHRPKDTASLHLCSCRVKRWHDPRWGEEWQGLAALHGLAGVACV